MKSFTSKIILVVLVSIGISFSAYAQSISISGKVTDASTSEGLPGATVLEKGTLNGMITDFDGNFTMSVKEGAVLSISFVGYASQEITIGNSTIINVTLEIDIEALEAVVVVGYGIQRESDLTGAVSIADPDEIKKQATNDVTQALQGRVAGVAVTTDGQPGATPQVRIRGISTFGGAGATAEPLYVVDGVPVSGIRDINPNDIETLQVLKDATAGAIYGNRAANGVIIITTKKGDIGKPLSVSLNAYNGWQKVPQRIPVLGREDYQEMIVEMEDNAGVPRTAGNDPNNPSYISNVDTDWQDESYKDGFISNVNLGVSGGNENTQYFVSFDYLTNEGTMVGNGPNYDRYSMRANTETQIDRVKFGARFLKVRSNEDPLLFPSYISVPGGVPSLSSALLQAIPTMPLYDENRVGGFGGADAVLHNAISLNVPGLNQLVNYETAVDRSLVNIYGEIELIDGLTYRLNVSYDNTGIEDNLFVPIYDLGYFFPNPTASYSVNNRNSTRFLIENTLNYTKSFGKHDLNVLAGQSFQADNFRSVNSTGAGLTPPYVLNLQSATDFGISDFIDKTTLSSFFGRLNYSFDDRYLLTANVRHDGSSKFAEENRYQMFPSLGLAWKIHNDFSMPAWITVMKLRGGIGQVGNQFIASYAYEGNINRSIPYQFGTDRVLGAAVTGPVDPSIQWETRTTRSVGVDAVMFAGKLDFTVEYYNNTSENVLLPLPIPLSTGYAAGSSILTNAGSIQNSGFEFSATHRQNIGDFSFEISPNFYTLQNEILDLGDLDNLPGTGTWNEVGRSLGEHYGWRYDGIFQNAAEIAASPTQFPGTSPGDIKFKDIAGAPDADGNPTDPDGVIDNNDRTFLGEGLPTYYYGLNITMKYKGFDFTIFGNGHGGSFINSREYRWLMFTSGYTNKHEDMLQRWTPSNTNTDVPRVVDTDPNGNGRDSDRPGWLQKGDYFRINTISLGYSLPTSILNKVKLSSVRFYATLQNVALFSSYKGYNPDFTSQQPGFGDTGTNPGLLSPGFDYGSFPRPKTTMLGVQIKF